MSENKTSDKEETPRTDAVALKRVLGAGNGTFTLEEVSADFARQLERELTESKANHREALDWLEDTRRKLQEALSARGDMLDRAEEK